MHFNTNSFHRPKLVKNTLNRDKYIKLHIHFSTFLNIYCRSNKNVPKEYPLNAIIVSTVHLQRIYNRTFASVTFRLNNLITPCDGKGILKEPLVAVTFKNREMFLRMVTQTKLQNYY